MDPKALFNITYGLYLLTARKHGKDNGCIINTAVQLTENPTQIAVTVIKRNMTHDMIRDTGAFNLSTLTTDADFELFRRFGMQSGRDADKFSGFPHAERSGNTIYRLTQSTNMFLSAVVTQEIDLGSHTMFIAEVTDAQVLSDAPACTYSYYQSHIKPAAKKAEKKQWECVVCGYIYEGEEVPDDYLCPLCHHGKEDFVLVQ